VMDLKLLLLLGCGIALAKHGKENSPSFIVDYENDRFLLDGEPFRYISGSIHYFRIHPDQWLDRLKRVRALGFNAIQYYIPWNFHEVERGRFDFSGSRDFARFSRLAESLGMYTLLRMGPYACAEWENGGLPYWLIVNDKDIRQRTNDTKFTSEVSRWFSVLSTQIVPLLRRNGGPVLMVQIENEYGSYFACDHAYTPFLREEVWRLLGKDTQLYTTDGSGEGYLKCGAVDGVYATVDFGPTIPQNVDKYFALQRKYLPNGRGPLVNSEFYPGWLVLWGQKEQQLPSDEAMITTAKTMWDKGASINFYMIHGGTNFGFWNGAETNAPVITSYDYSAPISENGDYTPAYWNIRDWIKSIPGWQNEPTSPPKSNEKKGYATASMQLKVPLMQMQKASCSASTNPLSFEDLRWQFGYVLYYTHLKTCGTNLTIEKVHDFGYVRLSGKSQGRFVKNFWDKNTTSVNLKGCQNGDTLEIIVENQGRQTYETINDFKGILSPVFLDGHPVTEWIQCGIDGPYEKVDDLVREGDFSREDNDEEEDSREEEGSQGGPGLYLGVFNVDQIADTWVNMTSWEKGHVIVNGHNIGRYWSKEGPQYNLYIPAPFLHLGRNVLAVFELVQVNGCEGDSCPLPFSATPDIHFDSVTYRDLHTSARRAFWKTKHAQH
ncbi:hypothetical protein PENTCL1PPCAC_2986, partial [Pristionchus entomophagus]